VIRRAILLCAAGLMLSAAAPQSWFNTSPTVPPIVSVKPQVLGTPDTPPGFEPAPTPNRDALRPVTKASRDASLAPGIFTRGNQYRGEGLAPSNSAQIEQERRAMPGAGINLSMPLQ
jgi:hypothetical protein